MVLSTLSTKSLLLSNQSISWACSKISAQCLFNLRPKTAHAVHSYLGDAWIGHSVRAELQDFSSTCSLFRHWEQKENYSVSSSGITKSDLNTHTQLFSSVKIQHNHRQVLAVAHRLCLEENSMKTDCLRSHKTIPMYSIFLIGPNPLK